jgi:hypothetical protein
MYIVQSLTFEWFSIFIPSFTYWCLWELFRNVIWNYGSFCGFLCHHRKIIFEMNCCRLPCKISVACSLLLSWYVRVRTMLINSLFVSLHPLLISLVRSELFLPQTMSSVDWRLESHFFVYTVHSVMIVFSAQLAEGEVASPFPILFHAIYHIHPPPPREN